jgi:hypothetical protein
MRIHSGESKRASAAGLANRTQHDFGRPRAAASSGGEGCFPIPGPATSRQHHMPPDYLSPPLVAHVECLLRSLPDSRGEALFPGLNGPALAQAVAGAPFVLVSHGREPDPILNYGNLTALRLWEMDWTEFIRTPSRLTAEAPERTERERLLATVTQRGFIDDYSGIRISKSGRRFRISRATVWNVKLPDGAPAGQAAMFDQWSYLD